MTPAKHGSSAAVYGEAEISNTCPTLENFYEFFSLSLSLSHHAPPIPCMSLLFTHCGRHNSMNIMCTFGVSFCFFFVYVSLLMKSIVPVVMAGVLGIYGLIAAGVISTRINQPSWCNYGKWCL